jgi:hypothetical protein
VATRWLKILTETGLLMEGVISQNPYTMVTGVGDFRVLQPCSSGLSYKELIRPPLGGKPCMQRRSLTTAIGHQDAEVLELRF